MKRRKKSTTHTEENTIQQEAGVDEEHGHGGASISDVPGPILMDIFSRLSSVKSIVRCRCVCKLWLEILLDPDFAKLHFSRTPTCLFLRDSSKKRLSRALYFVELDPDCIIFFCEEDDKPKPLSSCKLSTIFMCPKRNEKPRLSSCNINMKLSTIFMLPERNDNGSRKIDDRKFQIVNSCNGFLCLHGFECGNICRIPIVVYNPVTREFSVIPRPKYDSDSSITVGGLGFCPKTNHYKVLVIRSRWITKPGDSFSSCLEASIYTLGSGGWRRMGNAPIFGYAFTSPIFMNGALHWLVEDHVRNMFIMSFDFTSEQFLALPSPAAFCDRNRIDAMLQFPQKLLKVPVLNLVNKMRLGVLRGCLSICDNSSFDSKDIWVMKDYGVQESWFKEYNIAGLNEERSPFRLYQPTVFLSDGDLLMYQERNALFCVDNERRIRCFKIAETRSQFQSIAHIPSFFSLKDIMRDTIAVLNVRSSGSRKKIGERLFVVEENQQAMVGSKSS